MRRFDIVDGEPEPFNRLAPHYLADAAALDPPERQRASETTWRRRLVRRRLFKAATKY